MRDATVNRFRTNRGRLLSKYIVNASKTLGRDITILDVGGRPDYWDNVKLDGVGKIIVMNYDESEITRDSQTHDIFENVVGDARNLATYADNSVDFVHSNSVIEHVGPWWDMQAMANEVQRVGRHGWIQTPAFEFPVEPHYRLPFIHWFGAPTRRRLLRFSRAYGKMPIGEKRFHIDRINLLSHAEVKHLFPSAEIYVERVALLAKSYTAIW